MKIQVTSQDPRCAIITQNPATGEPDVDTLGIIRSYRSESAAAYFGVYAVVLHPGAVAEGDEIRLLETGLTSAVGRDTKMEAENEAGIF